MKRTEVLDTIEAIRDDLNDVINLYNRWKCLGEFENINNLSGHVMARIRFRYVGGTQGNFELRIIPANILLDDMTSEMILNTLQTKNLYGKWYNDDIDWPFDKRNGWYTSEAEALDRYVNKKLTAKQAEIT